jgi:hypothetical protein
MAEIIYRVPSDTVRYGYVEIKRQWPEDQETTPELLAAAYVSYVYAFQEEEQAATKRISEALSAPVSASQAPVEEKAKELLNEGLGGVTEVPAGDIVAHEATATSAPWVEVVDAKPKPWETGSEAPKASPVVSADW